MENQLTIAFGAGSEKFETMSRLLARSVARIDGCHSVAFLPQSEAGNISDESLSELESLCSELIVDTPTMHEYGQSSKLDAFVSAADSHDPPYMMLDTDTLLLSKPNIHFSDANLFAKPVDFGAQYWGSPASLPDWRDLYSEYGLDIPAKRTRSTVDGREILPYYNAGVVATNQPDFPERWRDLTEQIYTDINKAFYSDQVSLSMLMSDYKTEELTELENYPASVRLRFPSGISVLHYHQPENMNRIRNKSIKAVLDQLNVFNRLPSGLVPFTKAYIGSINRLVKYRVRRQIRYNVREVVK